MPGRLFALCAAAAFFVASPRVARAATCAPPAGGDPGLAVVDGRDRIHWIDTRLARTASRGRFWARGWAIGVGAAGVASLVPVPFVAADDRVDWYTSAVSAAVGVIPLWASPLSVTRDAPKLHAQIAASKWSDDDQVCALLVDAEQKLVADAANQKWQQGWWIHAGNMAFNTGVMLFLGLGYHHWSSGIINGVLGAGVGEAIIFTQPTDTINDLAAYMRGDLSTGAGQTSAGGSPWGWSYSRQF